MNQVRKKKILYLITKSNWGGAQRYVFDLATELSDHFDVAVALGGGGRLAEMLTERGIKIIPIPGLQRDISFRKEIAAARSISRIIRTERPDVLHVNSSKAGGIGALLGRIHGVPRIIFTAHGWAFNENRGVLTRGILYLLHWLTIMLAHRTIAVSSGLKRDMALPGAHQRMTVINPGRDSGTILPRDESRRVVIEKDERLRPYIDDIWVGTVAELHPVKGLSVAIESIGLLRPSYPTIRYILIGGGELLSELRELVAKRDLADHVFLVGEIPDAVRVLSALDVFVLPSRSEAFGYVLLEAGAAMLPVVASNVGGIPDIVEHGVSGTLVPPEDAEALANAVGTYLTDRHKATMHAESLHKKVRTFSVRHMVETTTRIYTRPD